MKTRLFPQLLSLLIFLAFAGHGESAHAVKLESKAHKVFNLSKTSTLLIDNRNGLVTIENWDENRISIEVQITVEHPSMPKAQTMLEGITVSLSMQDDQIMGITQIDEKLIRQLGSSGFGASADDIQIDYRIKMPVWVVSNLKLRYGDMHIDELIAPVAIDLKYGNLKANRIIVKSKEPLGMITLKYANATINELDWMRFEVKYANVEIEKVTALLMTSKYSNLTVDKAGSIVLEAKYDNVKIGEVQNLVATSGYTTFKIGMLGKQMELETKYGDVQVDRISPNLAKLHFDGSYGSLTAPIPPSVSYQLDAEVDYGSIGYSKPATVSRIEGTTKTRVSGVVGTNPNPQPQVFVRAKYSTVKL